MMVERKIRAVFQVAYITVVWVTLFHMGNFKNEFIFHNREDIEGRPGGECSIPLLHRNKNP